MPTQHSTFVYIYRHQSTLLLLCTRLHTTRYSLTLRKNPGSVSIIFNKKKKIVYIPKTYVLFTLPRQIAIYKKLSRNITTLNLKITLHPFSLRPFFFFFGGFRSLDIIFKKNVQLSKIVPPVFKIHVSIIIVQEHCNQT